jgi:hypothetical protein
MMIFVIKRLENGIKLRISSKTSSISKTILKMV